MKVQCSVGQRGRLIILVLYLAGLFTASWAALGTWIPPTSERGLWFYAALAQVVLGSLLVTPFFTKPVDAISYAVAATVALLAANAWVNPSASGFDRFSWSAAMFYVLLVLAAAILAISLKDSSQPLAQKLSRSGMVLADALGRPRAIFSAVFLFALVTYHRAHAREYLIIGLAWALFVGLHPLEALADLWRRLRIVWVTRQDLSRLGEVVRHETPRLVLIREDPDAKAELGDIVLARTESGEPGFFVALDHVGFAGGRWRRAIHVRPSCAPTEAICESAVARAVADGSAFRVGKDSLTRDTTACAALFRDRLVGFVAPNTDMAQLQLELVRTDLNIEEGSLVEVEMKGRPVLYQVTKGFTKEEALQEKNTRGFVCARARKIGVWDQTSERFHQVAWLPEPHEPVLLVTREQGVIDSEAIGSVCGTRYPVRVDLHDLVRHNAAILGILGVGKSFLALELVERMIRAGIKVLCLDLTSQYATELSEFLDAERDNAACSELQDIGRKGRTNVQQNVEEGGSVRQFRAKLKRQLGTFLSPDTDRRLKILDPSQFEVWRQDSRPYQRQASMATLTPPEITRIITEVALEVLQAKGMTEKARCCIVYEEAHSLIPEWTAVACEGEKAAANGTAKAIMQGRKFGLGCLVIAQRTANVTKSILNQCNTVFALRVFDATGMEFLKNYIGEDYASVLSRLPDRHAVIFGRASSCCDPVLIRLNDRAKFVQSFRETAGSAEQTQV